jgi:hypothetical protein
MPDGFIETEGEVHENQGGSLDITMNWDDAPVSSARRSIPDDSVWFSRESSADPLRMRLPQATRLLSMFSTRQ